MVRSDSRRKTRTGFAALCLCFHFFFSCPKATISTSILDHHSIKPFCPKNPLSEDILVIVRTGATEIFEKLPVHLNTTLRCISNQVIYSDYEEDIEGHHIHDVFDELSQDLRSSVPDFQMYHQLKARGRNSLLTQDFTHDGSRPMGQLNKPRVETRQIQIPPYARQSPPPQATNKMVRLHRA